MIYSKPQYTPQASTRIFSKIYYLYKLRLNSTQGLILQIQKEKLLRGAEHL